MARYTRDETWQTKDGRRVRVHLEVDSDVVIRSMLHRALTNKKQASTALCRGVRLKVTRE
jgi:hypothetical protein